MSVAGGLPPDFDIQPKRGFAMPFDAWLRGPLREVMEDTLDARAVRLEVCWMQSWCPASAHDSVAGKPAGQSRGSS
jgi:hypothetical protein